MAKKILAALLISAMVICSAGCSIGKDKEPEVVLPNGGLEGFVSNASITITVRNYDGENIVSREVSGVFDGEMVAGLPSGDGIFSVEEADGGSWTFSGFFEDGTFNGFGEITGNYSDGTNIAEKGTYTDGLFTPTLSEWIANVGSVDFAGYGEFSLNPNSRSTISTRPEAFPCEVLDNIRDLIDTNKTYAAIKNDLDNNCDRLVQLKNLSVKSVVDGFMFDRDASAVFCKDQQGNPWVIYSPTPSGYSAGDNIGIAYILPLSVVIFPGEDGNETDAVAALASYLF